MMSTDLEMLAWTTGLTGLMWMPYILARIASIGLMETLSYKSDNAPLPDWAERARKAHGNAVENLVLFAALVLTAHLSGAANEATAAAALWYFWIRVAHYAVFVLGIPYLRTVTFAVGWTALLCIFYQIVT
ncbi:MAG: MAPEG family protein [Alphaproteobacteria bacterium]|nr:MAPEG family protein [Alphaproteobacteria bacterium]